MQSSLFLLDPVAGLTLPRTPTHHPSVIGFLKSSETLAPKPQFRWPIPRPRAFISRRPLTRTFLWPRSLFRRDSRFSPSQPSSKFSLAPTQPVVPRTASGISATRPSLLSATGPNLGCTGPSSSDRRDVPRAITDSEEASLHLSLDPGDSRGVEQPVLVLGGVRLREA